MLGLPRPYRRMRARRAALEERGFSDGAPSLNPGRRRRRSLSRTLERHCHQRHYSCAASANPATTLVSGDPRDALILQRGTSVARPITEGRLRMTNLEGIVVLLPCAAAETLFAASHGWFRGWRLPKVARPLGFVPASYGWIDSGTMFGDWRFSSSATVIASDIFSSESRGKSLHLRLSLCARGTKLCAGHSPYRVCLPWERGGSSAVRAPSQDATEENKGQLVPDGRWRHPAPRSRLRPPEFLGEVPVVWGRRQPTAVRDAAGGNGSLSLRDSHSRFFHPSPGVVRRGSFGVARSFIDRGDG